MKEQIEKAIQKALAKLYPEHKDIDFSVDYAPANIDADFASNVAMVLSRRLGKKPMEVADRLRSVIPDLIRDPGSPSTAIGGLDSRLRGNDKFNVTVAPPGFLNFKLPVSVWQEKLSNIIKQGEKYGASNINKGKKARVEYVSANPTGPLHVGNIRGGPYGATISRVLEMTGYKVLREYFHNDVGGQVKRLGETVWHFYKKCLGEDVPKPEDGYEGTYPEEIAEKILKKHGRKLKKDKLLQLALEEIFVENQKVLHQLGINFEQKNIFKESSFQASGSISKAIEELKRKGFIKEKDGALWYAPSDEYLKDREAVVIKSDGKTPTYFAADIAYHKEKFTSRYDLVIVVLGSNHHGHVQKIKSLTKIFGFDPNRFVPLLYQYVRIKKGQEVVKMSKRTGNYVSVKEVLEHVGKDSLIFNTLMIAVDTHLDFDLDLAKDTSEKNPVYKVQYANARINSILGKANTMTPLTSPLMRGERGGSRPHEGEIKEGVLESLVTPEEINLIKELSKFPELVEEIAVNYSVHHLPHYLLELADKFHKFYEKVRVISDDEKLTAARLSLVGAVKTVLGSGLKLMGIEPQEKM